MLYSKTRHIIGRRSLLAAAGSTLAFPAIVRAQGKKAGVALVIGNSRYQWEAQLPNVKRDAPDIAKRFQALGLQTELVQDAPRDAMQRAIDKFKSAASGANLAAFYFAGHGVNWGKDTYVVPLDADLSTPNTVQTLIKVPSIEDAMGVAANRLLVFDNCRNNPADGWRQLEAQRASRVTLEDERAGLTAPPNTLILFSTAPGRVALDGPAGENSPFAAALLRQLNGQSVDLQTLPGKMRRDLLIATAGNQVLWDFNTYRQAFVLSGPAASIAANRSGWSGDPSKVVELTNTYAYAQQNGIPLPPGLIAHRPTGKSSDNQKVGSFNFTNGQRGPTLILVMSVEEKRSGEVILAGVEGGSNVPYWRFVTASLSGNDLEFTVGGGQKYTFTWSDANSGSVTRPGGGTRKALTSARFTRLDG